MCEDCKVHEKFEECVCVCVSGILQICVMYRHSQGKQLCTMRLKINQVRNNESLVTNLLHVNILTSASKQARTYVSRKMYWASLSAKTQ